MLSGLCTFLVGGILGALGMIYLMLKAFDKDPEKLVNTLNESLAKMDCNVSLSYSRTTAE